MESEKIYNKVDKLRQDKGWSIYNMAKKAGVSYASIYKWRDRKSSPTLYLLESLCEVLGVHIVNLLITDNELVYFPDEDRDFFHRWSALTSNQKSAVAELVKTLQNNQKK